MLASGGIIKHLQAASIASPFVRLVGQTCWNELRYQNETWPFRNIQIQDMTSIDRPSFTVEGIFDATTNLVLKDCHPMFVFHWLTKQNFPNTRNIFMICPLYEEAILRFPNTTRFFIGYGYDKYFRTRPKAANVQTMSMTETKYF